jgi:hypothetical protein
MDKNGIGSPHWKNSGLWFEKKQLIPALQQRLTNCQKPWVTGPVALTVNICGGIAEIIFHSSNSG